MPNLIPNGTPVQFLRTVENMAGDYAFEGQVGVIEHGSTAEQLDAIGPSYIKHQNMYTVLVRYNHVIVNESDIRIVGK